jgi:hypothetical protein
MFIPDEQIVTREGHIGLLNHVQGLGMRCHMPKVSVEPAGSLLEYLWIIMTWRDDNLGS